VDASAILGRLGAPVALLQSRILPTATEAYIRMCAFEKSPGDKPHTCDSWLSRRRWRSAFSALGETSQGEGKRLLQSWRLCARSDSYYYPFQCCFPAKISLPRKGTTSHKRRIWNYCVSSCLLVAINPTFGCGSAALCSLRSLAANNTARPAVVALPEDKDEL